MLVQEKWNSGHERLLSMTIQQWVRLDNIPTGRDMKHYVCVRGHVICIGCILLCCEVLCVFTLSRDTSLQVLARDHRTVSM